MNDPEYGRVRTSRWLRGKVDWARRNYGRVRFFLQTAFAGAVVLIARAALVDMDSVVRSANAITFEEEVYEPFTWNAAVRSEFASLLVKPVVVKGASVNVNAQRANLAELGEFVRERYLAPPENYICLHAKYLGVLFDVTVFRNLTVVNPSVRRESEEITHNRETALDGSERMTVRPHWIEISHYDERLEARVTTLYGDQAACFTHYFSENADLNQH